MSNHSLSWLTLNEPVKRTSIFDKFGGWVVAAVFIVALLVVGAMDCELI